MATKIDRPVQVLGVTCIACLLGCGQNDAEGDTATRQPRPDAATPSQGGSDEPNELCPLRNGARWTYRHAGGTSPWDEEATLEAVSFMGEDAFLLTSTPGPDRTHNESILVARGRQVLRIHREEYMATALVLSVDYDPGFLRFDAAWTEANEGEILTETYERVEFDPVGTQTRMGSRSHRYTVQALSDTVEVPAGIFENCLRMQRSRVRMVGQAPMEGDDDLFWYCPGIGKVREEDQTTGETEELLSCDVPEGACP